MWSKQNSGYSDTKHMWLEYNVEKHGCHFAQRLLSSKRPAAYELNLTLPCILWAVRWHHNIAFVKTNLWILLRGLYAHVVSTLAWSSQSCSKYSFGLEHLALHTYRAQSWSHLQTLERSSNNPSRGSLTWYWYWFCIPLTGLLDMSGGETV